jgi:hypothetical protein
LNKDLSLKDLLLLIVFPYMLAGYALLCIAYAVFCFIYLPIERLIETLKNIRNTGEGS